MGLTPAFLIKHIRPLGLSTADMMFSQQFRDFLQHDLQMTRGDIANLAEHWGAVALQDPATAAPAFEAAANAVARARWDELYRTGRSTVFFLMRDQLATLSAASEHGGPNRSWVVDFSHNPIRIAVTISQNGPSAIQRNVDEINIATDAQSNICHLNG